jgi:hypothetical protein
MLDIARSLSEVPIRVANEQIKCCVTKNTVQRYNNYVKNEVLRAKKFIMEGVFHGIWAGQVECNNVSSG